MGEDLERLKFKMKKIKEAKKIIDEIDDRYISQKINSELEMIESSIIRVLGEIEFAKIKNNFDKIS